MNPIQTSELDVQFALGISPWWLLAIVPAVAAVGMLLYRGQGQRVPRGHFLGLCALRVALFALLGLLFFRPSVLHRTMLRYPGRVLLVVDDSASMEAADGTMDAAQALRLARSLGRIRPDAQCAAADVAGRLRTMEAAFWRWRASALREGWTAQTFIHAAGTLQDEFFADLDAIAELVTRIPAGAEQDRAGREAAAASLEAVRQQIGTLFAGERLAEPSACAAFGRLLDTAAERHLAIQDRVDTAELGAGSAPLAEALVGIRAAPRGRLVADMLAAHVQTFGANAQGQWLQTVRLSDGATAPFAGRVTFAPSEAPTAILARLKALAEEEHAFPLSAMMLFSDGRQFGEAAEDEVLALLARRQIPVSAALAGGANEPHDLSVLALSAPPFAVAGSPVTVRARLKTSLPKVRPGRIELLEGGTVLAALDLELGHGPDAAVELSFTPAAEGLRTYTLRVAAVEGEAFAGRNNAADCCIRVRADKVRALLLDWRPRWETQFAMNALSRLEWLDFNPVIVLAGAEAALARGVGPGNWPESAEALAAYDVIILGDVPPDLLTQAEWDALERTVTDAGRTLCLLAPRTLRQAPALASWFTALAPMALPSPKAGEALHAEDLRIAASGKAHPLTRALRHGLPEATALAAVASAAAVSEARLFAGDTQPLVMGHDGAPRLAARLVGKGKVLEIDTDRLWQALNVGMIDAHRELFAALPAWALGGGWLAGDGDIALDRQTLRAGDPLQMWSRTPVAITLATAEGFRAELTTEPVMEGGLCVAVATGLPAGEVTLETQNGPAATVRVIDDNPELLRLAADAAFLGRIAEHTGGELRPLAEAERLFLNPPVRERVERTERVWRLWDSGAVLALLMLMITIEWVWRKWMGLI